MLHVEPYPHLHLIHGTIAALLSLILLAYCAWLDNRSVVRREKGEDK